MDLCVTCVCMHLDAVVNLRVQMCVVVGLCMSLRLCVCVRASAVWVCVLENLFFSSVFTCVCICFFALDISVHHIHLVEVHEPVESASGHGPYFRELQTATQPAHGVANRPTCRE